MSDTLHHSDEDNISRSNAAESEMAHRDADPPTPSQEEREPTASEDRPDAPGTDNPRSITAPNEAETEAEAHALASPGSAGSLEVVLDVPYDLEAYLEEFSRLARKGRFEAAVALFHACPPDLRMHPECALDFVDALSRQGAYGTLADFAAGEGARLMARLRGCGAAPVQYVRCVFELGRWRVCGAVDGSWREGVEAGDARSQLRANFERLDSVQVQLLCNLMQLDSEVERSTKRHRASTREAEMIMGSSSDWHGLYKHLLSTNRIWDMRDLFHALYSRYGVADAIKLSLDDQKRVIPSGALGSDNPDLNGWFRFVLDWTQCFPRDESTDFALLDLLVTMSLQLLSHGRENAEAIKKIIAQAMTHANHFAISLSLGNPENVQTSPYLKWALAHQRLARELPINVRRTPSYAYLARAAGVVVWNSNLPIFVPVGSVHDRDRVTWEKQSRTTSEHLLHLGLSAARKNGDYVLEAQYWEEMFYTSDAPLDVLGQLSRLQRDVQGDGVGCLRTCLTKYLCVSDETSMEELSHELQEQDHRDSESESTWSIDPVTRWCQRAIQSALSHHLGRALQTGAFLEEEERAYEELPCDFKRLLEDVKTGKDDRGSRVDADNLDGNLSERSAEFGMGTLYRDGNFIICDSSGYFSRVSAMMSFEGGGDA
ncbi:hypothetical protein MFRU_024g01000 [Monilinia fructicola]|nr:hypothetical protein MFRU_024g01000 [Monilinia fructicola]